MVDLTDAVERLATFETQMSRRSLLSAGACMAFAAALRSAPASGMDSGYRITAASANADILGTNHTNTAVWAYNGTVPGPVLRMRQGEPVRILVENRLAEPTTVHWHGIRLPIAMDGVPGISQPPIKPGEVFTYEFTPPDAGTFWYHPHMDSLQQIGRGLSGALIVEEHEPPAVDRDLVWMLADWRLSDDDRIIAGFGNAMEATMSGRVGNTPSR